jgi:hypothetical protein
VQHGRRYGNYILKIICRILAGSKEDKDQFIQCIRCSD